MVGVGAQERVGGGEEDVRAVGAGVAEERCVSSRAGRDQVERVAAVLVDVTFAIGVSGEEPVGGAEEDLTVVGQLGGEDLRREIPLFAGQERR